jgi:gp16 family phage-associated protein
MGKNLYEIDSALLQKVRSGFVERGESIAEWANKNGFRLTMVYAVLAGRQKCLRGEGHHVAVALGLKASPASLPNDAISDDMNQT